MKKFDKIYILAFSRNYNVYGTPNPEHLILKEISAENFEYIDIRSYKVINSLPVKNPCNCLFLAFDMAYHMWCLTSLNIQKPKNLICLRAEFRNLTNGSIEAKESTLHKALKYFGHSVHEHISHNDGQTRNDLEKEIKASEKLFLSMRNSLNWEQALFRGEYCYYLSIIQNNGIPIDNKTLKRVKLSKDLIIDHLINEIPTGYKFFINNKFSIYKLSEFIRKNNIDWPLTEKRTEYRTDNEAFKFMSCKYPEFEKVREVIKIIKQFQSLGSNVSADSRSRVYTNPFGSKTGRNQPSSSKFILGGSKSFRALIQPKKGNVIANIDYCQQEFGIAAFKSGDKNMIKAYESSDPYLAFAEQSGENINLLDKNTFRIIRNKYKLCILAVQYGMSEKSLAHTLSTSRLEASHLIKKHKDTYKSFWNWSENVAEYGRQKGKLFSSLGWNINIAGNKMNERSVKNFPMQSDAAEMLKISLITAIQKGIKICATNHDSFLIEAPEKEINRHVEIMQRCMKEASKIILQDGEIKTEAQIFSREIEEGRYVDDLGFKTWKKIIKIIEKGAHI